MPTWTAVAGFAVASLAIAAAPGPSWAYVISTTVRAGFRGSLFAIAGNGLGILIHVVAAALGLSVLVAVSPVAFNVVKWLGAFYLIYLGLRTLALGKRPLSESDHATDVRISQVFREGVLVNVLNPKVLILMLALLPQFVDPLGPSGRLQTLLVGSIHAIIASGVLLTVAGVTARARVIFGADSRATRWLRYASGAVLIALGAELGIVS